MSKRQRLSRIKKYREDRKPKVAPKGYHYMPNGELMSDYEHQLLYGDRNALSVLPEEFRSVQRKTSGELVVNPTSGRLIHGINIDLNDINITGETRRFSVMGDSGAQFSLQVLDTTSGGKYYDFNNSTWTTTESILQNQIIIGGSYTGVIVFDPPGKLHNYEIRLIAIPSGCNPTTHVKAIERRFADGTIDYNGSTGSNSAVLIKKIHSQVGSQSVLTLSCISPTFGDSGEVNVGMTPDPGSTTGADTVNISTGESLEKHSFSITLTADSGHAFAILKTPTTDDLCAVRTVTFDSAALPIEGEDVSSSTFYRWPVTNAGGGVAGLANGMVLDPSSTAVDSGTTQHNGVNTTASSFISDYGQTVTERRVKTDKCREVSYDVDHLVVAIPGVAATGDATVTRGVVTAQAGNIVFNNQQADALKSDTNVRIIGYGRDAIKSMTFGTDIEISNVKLELTEISTTISDASATGSASLSDFDVASVTGIMDEVSVLEAVNVTKTAAKPQVSAISSSNITVTPGGHLLQNGQTVKFLGASNILTITGDIKIHKMGIQNTTIFFDVERFLLAK